MPRAGRAARAGVDRIGHVHLPAHLREPRGGHIRTYAVVVGQDNAGAAHGDGVVSLLHELSARGAGKAGQVAGGIFLGRAHVQLVERAVRGFQLGNVGQGNAGHVGTFRHGAGISLGLRAGLCGHGFRVPTVDAVVQHLIGQQPADGAIAQRRHRVGNAGIHERLRADDAARAPGTVDDDLRGRVRRQFTDAQHKLRPRHAGRSGDAHGLEFVIAARIDDHHVALGIEQRLDFLRAERRRVALCLHVFAKGFAGHVHVLEDLAASRTPAIQTTFEQIDTRVAEFSQFGGRLRGQVHAVVHAIQNNQRIPARNARPCLQLQPRERQVGRPQRVRLRVWVFFAHIDQGDFLAGQQRSAHVSVGERGDVGLGQRCGDRRVGGFEGVDGGTHEADVSLERSQRLGR